MTATLSLHRLFYGLAMKTYVLRKRYLFDTINQLALVYVLFLIVFLGGQSIAPTAITENRAGIVVGYFVWSMSIRGYRSLSLEILREARWGTLEQLYLNPFGFGKVMLVQTVVNVLESFVTGSVLLGLLLVTTGAELYLDVLTVVPLILLTIASAVGIGFVLGGLALLYKRIQSLFMMVQFLLLAFIAAPIDQQPAFAALPLSLGTKLLQRSMESGTRLWELPSESMLLLVAKAIIYLLIGYGAFMLALQRARRGGKLGQY